MGRILTANVVVRNQEDTGITILNVGDELPDWAADQVGEHVLGGVTSSASDPYKVDTSDVTLVKLEDGTEVSVNHESDSPEVKEAEGTQGEAEELAEEDEDVPYEEWSKTDLQVEAKGRGLEGLSKATKEELIEALEADDEE